MASSFTSPHKQQSGNIPQPQTPARTHSASRPQTPASDYSSYSAFTESPGRKEAPVHLSTVGRRELVTWVNDVLDLDPPLRDISEAANGAVACQMLDRLNPLNPEVVNMRRVDFNANSSYYITKNWRILQLAFVELQIDWNVDVNRCQLGHQMDLLLLFRWFRQRYETWEAEMHARGEELPPYDAKNRRAQSKTGDVKDPMGPSSPSRPASRHNWHDGIASPGADGDDSAKAYEVKSSKGTSMGASMRQQPQQAQPASRRFFGCFGRSAVAA